MTNNIKESMDLIEKEIENLDIRINYGSVRMKEKDKQYKTLLNYSIAYTEQKIKLLEAIKILISLK